jgi:histidine phosphotransferase ChpT
MSDAANLRVASLLASRLCHDLVGPLGAVDNGLELIAEGGSMAEEALTLAQRSAKRATSRLQYFRYAFGAAGAESSFGAGEAQAFAQTLLQNGEIQLDWPEAGGDALHPGVGRLLLNLVLLGIDCLPRGGRIQILLRPDCIGVESSGPHARLTPELKAAIEGTCPPSELTARTVVGRYAALLAGSLGGRIEILGEGPDRVGLQAAFVPLKRT